MDLLPETKEWKAVRADKSFTIMETDEIIVKMLNGNHLFVFVKDGDEVLKSPSFEVKYTRPLTVDEIESQKLYIQERFL
jgi:hypothetical protein